MSDPPDRREDAPDGADGGRPAGELPVVDPPARGDPDRTPPDPDRSPRVVGALLAAGLGTRFGDDEDNKLLADDGGDPVVVRAVRSLLGAGLPAVAVLGHEAEAVGAALRSVDAGGRLALVGNPDYRTGQATSIRAALRAVRGADAVVFALGDMPRVDPDSVRALVDAYAAGAGAALAAACEGRRGNPVLFDATHFPALADVDGDVGGREILLSDDRSALVETGDPGVLRDVDTVADLDRL